MAAAPPAPPAAPAAPVPPERRIARITAHPLRCVLPATQRTSQGDWAAIEIVIVEVETAAGLAGVGECLARRGALAYAGFIEQVLAPLLVDQDLADRRRLWRRMRGVLTGRTGGMLVEALAGLDIALWDLAGKLAGEPVHRLLGGMGRREVPCYASSINWSDDATCEREIAAALAAGFRSIKVKVGRPVAAARERVRLARRLAGEAVELSVDANWAYDLDDAVAVGRALADHGYAWFEEPLVPEDRAGYARLRAAVPVRLAAGESDFCAADALALLADRSIGLVQPDVARAGGISETWRIAELAQAHGVAYAPHVGWSGAVCAAASLQLAAAAEACLTYECMVFPNPLREQMLLQPVSVPATMAEGRMPVPQGPGLGIEVDPAFLAAHRVR